MSLVNKLYTRTYIILIRITLAKLSNRSCEYNSEQVHTPTKYHRLHVIRYKEREEFDVKDQST